MGSTHELLPHRNRAQGLLPRHRPGHRHLAPTTTQQAHLSTTRCAWFIRRIPQRYNTVRTAVFIQRVFGEHIMLWFVTTRSRDLFECEYGETNFWIVLANTPAEIVEMMDDEYTEVVDFTDNVTEGLIEQYGGVALLTTP